VTVHLLQLPVPLAAQARQHFEGLTREFMLIAAGGDEHEVPTRLMQLVEALTGQYAGLNTRADQELVDAIDAGAPAIADHVLVLPRQAGPAAQMLGDMIDEADEYCRSGQHLLTLATPPESLAYRRWYLGQVVGQLEGAAPVAWPESPEARSL
jgi:hypothetical protein